MSADATKSCPYCSETIQAVAVKCRFCGEFLDERSEPLIPPEALPEERAVRFIVPVDVSGWALVACYAGLIGLCFPFIGLLFAIPGLISGIVAVNRMKKQGTTAGNARAVLGLIFSTLGILLWGGAIIYVLLKQARLV